MLFCHGGIFAKAFKMLLDNMLTVVACCTQQNMWWLAVSLLVVNVLGDPDTGCAKKADDPDCCDKDATQAVPPAN